MSVDSPRTTSVRSSRTSLDNGSKRRRHISKIWRANIKRKISSDGLRKKRELEQQEAERKRRRKQRWTAIDALWRQGEKTRGPSHARISALWLGDKATRLRIAKIS